MTIPTTINLIITAAIQNTLIVAHTQDMTTSPNALMTTLIILI
jgi:hypothetical protein